jgi:transposase
VCKLLQHKNVFNQEHLEKIYIDSTDIMNKLGSEDVGRSYKYKFKKATKITIITDSNGIPISIHITKASIHDAKLVESTIDKLQVKIITSKNYPKYLIADRGYISKTAKNNIKEVAELVYPLKQNMKSTETADINERNKLLLRSRSINENTFSWLKNCKRLNVRYDRLTTTFSSFIHLKVLSLIGTKITNNIICI